MKYLIAIVISIISFTVQSAEIIRDRDLLGEWSTFSLNNGAGTYELVDGSGRIRFYSNHTFQILSGKNAVVIGCLGDCTGIMGKWSIQDGVILMMQRDGIDPNTSQYYMRGWGFVMANEGKTITFARGSNQVLMKYLSK